MEVWYQREYDADYLYVVLLYEYPLPSYQQNIWMGVGFGFTNKQTYGFELNNQNFYICRFYLNEAK